MSTRQVFTATLAVLAGLATGYILLMSLRILIILLIAVIVASAARTLIARLVRAGLPEGVAIPVIYAGIVLSFLILAGVVIPPLINQFADYLGNDWRLANRIVITNNWLERTLTTISGQEVTLASSDDIRAVITDLLDDVRASAPGLLDDAGGILGETVLVIVMGIYWLTSRDKAITFITRLVAQQHQQNTREALLEIEESLGTYIRGVVFVGLFVGMANFIILFLLRVPNAATYGFIVGVTTLLPVIGGFIGGISVTLLALLGSPIYGLAAFGTFVAVQQIEVHYLTPRVMSRSIGVDPLLVMVAIFVGFALYGVIGAIISVPILGTLYVLIREFVIEPRQEEVAPYSMQEGVPVFKVTPSGIIEPAAPSAVMPENSSS